MISNPLGLRTKKSYGTHNRQIISTLEVDLAADYVQEAILLSYRGNCPPKWLTVMVALHCGTKSWSKSGGKLKIFKESRKDRYMGRIEKKSYLLQ
jgi:hypothetical protein